MGEFKDRIGSYLKGRLDDYLFDELSDEYLEKARVLDVLSGVPVPIKKTELEKITNLRIANGMAVVMGADINFKYRDNYIEYIKRSFGGDFTKFLMSQGVEAAEKGDYEYAAIIFRAILLLEPDNADALYCYGLATKDAYGNGEGEEYIGRFKAESMETFEKLIAAHPDYHSGYYFLGYAYLNLGLYTKAKLVWDRFMELTENLEAEEDKKSVSSQRLEIADWMEKLEEPIKIEGAYNMVLSGRFEEGISRLLPYTEDERFSNWWPLWYYLGIAYESTGNLERAVESFKKALTLAPGHIQSMEELVEIYGELGDTENEEKYRNKIKLVKKNGEEFRAEKNPEYS